MHTKTMRWKSNSDVEINECHSLHKMVDLMRLDFSRKEYANFIVTVWPVEFQNDKRDAAYYY